MTGKEKCKTVISLLTLFQGKVMKIIKCIEPDTEVYPEIANKLTVLTLNFDQTIREIEELKGNK